uniref:Putative secreted protein n=1 Tax=Amblyomma triste TaxID=251400 RepID=A0A023FZT8_AMBTT
MPSVCHAQGHQLFIGLIFWLVQAPFNFYPVRYFTTYLCSLQLGGLTQCYCFQEMCRSNTRNVTNTSCSARFSAGKIEHY